LKKTIQNDQQKSLEDANKNKLSAFRILFFIRLKYQVFKEGYDSRSFKKNNCKVWRKIFKFI